MQRLDIILVAALVGLRAAAIYTAATRFMVVGQFVNQAVSLPVQPRLSALLAIHDKAGAKALYRVSTTWLVLLMWPLFGACIALAPTYLALFGRGYRDAVAVVVILSLSMLLASACGVVDSVIIMAGRTSWNLATTLLALAVNVGVDLWLIPSTVSSARRSGGARRWWHRTSCRSRWPGSDSACIRSVPVSVSRCWSPASASS